MQSGSSCPEMRDVRCELEKRGPSRCFCCSCMSKVIILYMARQTHLSATCVFPYPRLAPPSPRSERMFECVYLCLCVCSFWSAQHVKFVKFIKIPLPMPTSDWQQQRQRQRQRQRCWCRKVPRAEPTSGNRNDPQDQRCQQQEKHQKQQKYTGRNQRKSTSSVSTCLELIKKFHIVHVCNLIVCWRYILIGKLLCFNSIDYYLVT